MPQGYLWLIFAIVFIGALVLDLGVFQRKSHAIPVKEALKLVGFWVALAVIFNVFVYFFRGRDSGIEFTTAYLVEYSLSVDNLFVFLAMFTYFAVPREAQRRVLLWGILGAVVFRGLFIFAGIELIERFRFLVYVLGLVVIFTGVKLLTQKEKEVDPGKNVIVRFIRKVIPCDSGYCGASFFTRVNGALSLTPLFIVLVSIETMDIIFATDSVPAVLSITLDPFIVYTSNIFAILGLRALFFAIAGLFYIFRYLGYGISIVLIFIGTKILISDIYKMPVGISLGVVGLVLAGSILASVITRSKNKAAGEKAVCSDPRDGLK